MVSCMQLYCSRKDMGPAPSASIQGSLCLLATANVLPQTQGKVISASGHESQIMSDDGMSRVTQSPCL